MLMLQREKAETVPTMVDLEGSGQTGPAPHVSRHTGRADPPEVPRSTVTQVLLTEHVKSFLGGATAAARVDGEDKNWAAATTSSAKQVLG